MNETETDIDACVWRLFDTNMIDVTNIDYHMFIFLHSLINCDVYLILQKMPVEINNEWTIDVSDFQTINVTELQEDAGDYNPFVISWKDLPEHLNVYLMAKRSNLRNSNFKF